MNHFGHFQNWKKGTTHSVQKLFNFLHPDRPAWTWMPTLKGPLRPLWPLYRRWAWWRERRDSS